MKVQCQERSFQDCQNDQVKIFGNMTEWETSPDLSLFLQSLQPYLVTRDATNSSFLVFSSYVDASPLLAMLRMRLQPLRPYCILLETGTSPDSCCFASCLLYGQRLCESPQSLKRLFSPFQAKQFHFLWFIQHASTKYFLCRCCYGLMKKTISKQIQRN